MVYGIVVVVEFIYELVKFKNINLNCQFIYHTKTTMFQESLALNQRIKKSNDNNNINININIIRNPKMKRVVNNYKYILFTLRNIINNFFSLNQKGEPNIQGNINPVPYQNSITKRKCNLFIVFNAWSYFTLEFKSKIVFKRSGKKKSIRKKRRSRSIVTK